MDSNVKPIQNAVMIRSCAVPHPAKDEHRQQEQQRRDQCGTRDPSSAATMTGDIKMVRPVDEPWRPLKFRFDEDANARAAVTLNPRNETIEFIDSTVDRLRARAYLRPYFSFSRAWSSCSCAFASACLEEAREWARRRHTFGRPLVEHQEIGRGIKHLRHHQPRRRRCRTREPLE